MKRFAAVMALGGAVTLAAGCATERRVISDNSPSAKFASLFEGNTATSNGPSGGGMWQVNRGGAPVENKPVSEQARRIAELLKQQANDPRRPRPSLSDPSYNTGGWNITTNFETSDSPAPRNDGPAPVNRPAGDPWGAAPLVPGASGNAGAPAAPGSRSTVPSR